MSILLVKRVLRHSLGRIVLGVLAVGVIVIGRTAGGDLGAAIFWGPMLWAWFSLAGIVGLIVFLGIHSHTHPLHSYAEPKAPEHFGHRATNEVIHPQPGKFAMKDAKPQVRPIKPPSGIGVFSCSSDRGQSGGWDTGHRTPETLPTVHPKPGVTRENNIILIGNKEAADYLGISVEAFKKRRQRDPSLRTHQGKGSPWWQQSDLDEWKKRIRPRTKPQVRGTVNKEEEK